MSKNFNTTDLHIQYHIETGEWHEWRERYSGRFQSEENYSREYAKWIEEKYLELRTLEESQKILIKDLYKNNAELAEHVQHLTLDD